MLQEPCLGCPAPVDVNSTDIQELATLAVTEVQKFSNSPYQHSLIKVVQGTQQVSLSKLAN